jgi:hypothetical protein
VDTQQADIYKECVTELVDGTFRMFFHPITARSLFSSNDIYSILRRLQRYHPSLRSNRYKIPRFYKSDQNAIFSRFTF